jgi:GntR family transcriptional regulator
VYEIQQAVTFVVEGYARNDGSLAQALAGVIPVALPNKGIEGEVPAGCDLLMLELRSVPSSLVSWLPAPADALIGIASAWPGFLQRARTVLIAAGFNSDCLIFRNTRKKNWRTGLDQTAAIVCDALTATDLPKHPRILVFPLLSESCLKDLRAYQEFVSAQL